MLLKTFAIHDSKANAYMRPFFMPTTGMAVRAFTDLVQDKTHEVGKHPADYTLFEIAEYNEENAQISPLINYVNLGNGITYQVQQELNVDQQQIED